MFKYDKNLTFSFADKKKTAADLVSVEDKRTGYKVTTSLPNPDRQTASLNAFAGARFSRSGDSVPDIFAEIREAGGNAQEKLANIFKNYGHASVADMGNLFLYIENIPQIYAAKFFNETSIGGGQERSTRYQDFGNLKIHDLKDFIFEQQKESGFSKISLGQNTIFEKKLENYKELNDEFKALQDDSLGKYRKYVDKLTKKYREVYKPEDGNKAQKAALAARVFDSARYFLQSGLGNRTSLAWVTSAREWSRIISFFKSGGEKRLKYLAEQIEVLLAPDADFAEKIGYLPEAPDLIRHTSTENTSQEFLKGLEDWLGGCAVEPEFVDKREFKKVATKLYTDEFTPGEKTVAQNILTLHPALKEDWVLHWVKDLSDEQKSGLGELLNSFDHHKQMGMQFKLNTHTFVLDCSIAEARDLNRHRVWGRFIPAVSTKNYLELLTGQYALPAYLYENPKLSEIRKEFEDDLLEYYEKLEKFVEKAIKQNWFPQELIVELLPFAHITKMFMHGSPKGISYLTKLRVRPGGHINYRMIAYQMAEEAAKSDPLLSGLKLPKKPDPTSSEEFFDRS